MIDNYICLIVNDYYKESIKNILENLLSSKVYCISKINYINDINLPYSIKSRFYSYKKCLDEGCNIILNYNDDIIMNKLIKDNYKFEVFNINSNFIIDYKTVKKINKKINIFKYNYYKLITKLTIYFIDKLQEFINLNIGFEITKGTIERINKSINNNLTSTLNIRSIIKQYFYYKNRLKNIKLDKPNKCLKVGIISNNYILNELYFNHTIEELSSNKNIEVKRYTNRYINNYILNKYYFYKIRKYCKYNIKNNITQNIYRLIKLIKKEYDGIILLTQYKHIDDEILNIIINNICRNENISFINIDFDENISEIKIDNTIDVFYDMITINNAKKKDENT